MTQPPPSGPWGAQPPQQPGNWQGYPGGQQGPGPQGQWNPQQQWPNPAPAPQKKGPLKWIFGGIALIAVIAVTAVGAVSCAGGKGSNSGNGGGTPSSGSKPDIASANDTGPVSVITEDPSCAPWGPIATTLSNVEDNGWKKRDASAPASGWSADAQTQYQAVATAMRSAADQTVPLTKVTTHRVMRELYSQFIAYSRTYAERIATYVPADNDFATVASDITGLINGICQSISFGSAAARSPLVPPTSPPTKVAEIGNLTQPPRFLTSPISQCTDWKNAIEQINSDPAYTAWMKIDPSLPASNWSPQDRATNDAVAPVLTNFSHNMEQLGRKSSNPVIEDFAALGAQYGQATVLSIPTYSQPDSYLYDVNRLVSPTIAAACRATGAT